MTRVWSPCPPLDVDFFTRAPQIHAEEPLREWFRRTPGSPGQACSRHSSSSRRQPWCGSSRSSFPVTSHSKEWLPMGTLHTSDPRRGRDVKFGVCTEKQKIKFNALVVFRNVPWFFYFFEVFLRFRLHFIRRCFNRK